MEYLSTKILLSLIILPDCGSVKITLTLIGFFVLFPITAKTLRALKWIFIAAFASWLTIFSVLTCHSPCKLHELAANAEENWYLLVLLLIKTGLKLLSARA